MSHPDPTHEDLPCEYWSEVDDEQGSVEYCTARIKDKVYGQCSCSGQHIECNNGMYMPYVRTDDPSEDR